MVSVGFSEVAALCCDTSSSNSAFQAPMVAVPSVDGFIDVWYDDCAARMRACSGSLTQTTTSKGLELVNRGLSTFLELNRSALKCSLVIEGQFHVGRGAQNNWFKKQKIVLMRRLANHETIGNDFA